MQPSNWGMGMSDGGHDHSTSFPWTPLVSPQLRRLIADAAKIYCSAYLGECSGEKAVESLAPDGEE